MEDLSANCDTLFEASPAKLEDDVGGMSVWKILVSNWVILGCLGTSSMLLL